MSEMAGVQMSKLDWSSPDQIEAFNEWRDFLRSYLVINKVGKKNQWHYTMLSAGSEGKDLWDSWQLDDTTKEDPEALFKKYQTHLRGTESKWVRRLELSAITQLESENGGFCG